jgi:folate-binding protein YgfZ
MNLTSGTATRTALLLTGRDVLDLLHRISTRFLTDLGLGQGRATMFCDFRGRLLYRAWVERDAAGAVWLLGPDAPAGELAAFLDRHIFREDVTVVNRSADVDAPALPAEERFATEVDRIRAGHPRHAHEISDEFTPFEIGRAHEVHLQKGCFTGQEALMRLVTYQSVRRELMLIEGAGPAPATPSDLRRGEAKLGRLTSAVALASEPTPAASPRWIGLAVLAKGETETGSGCVAGDGATIERITPFPRTRPEGLPADADPA